MEQFKASDEDWRTVEALCKSFCGEGHRAIRELRDRVAKLEAEREAKCKPVLQVADDLTPEREPSPSPAEDAGLVRQVAKAIGGDDWEIWGEESRDVIRIVARWLRKKRYYLASALLEPEANR